MNRFSIVGLLLVSGSLAACGSDPQPQPDAMTPTPDMTEVPDMMESPDVPIGVDRMMADVSRDVRTDAPTDAGMTCGRLPYTTVMRTGATTTVRGDTTMAFMEQTMGMPPRGMSPIRPPTNNSSCTAMTGQLVYAYTTGPMPASLRISTTNPGTPRNFDTVLWVTTRCANTLAAAACNDDDPEFEGSPDRRVSSLVTTEVLPAGTQVFIIIGGFYPPGDGMVTTDRGPFEMTINEQVPVAMGGACATNGLSTRCNTGLVCAPTTFGAPMGTCVPLGSAAGTGCRASEPRCDVGLTCTMNNVCVRSAMPEMACDPFTVCPDGYYCHNLTLGATSGTCRRLGSLLGSPCRPMGMMGARCDAPQVCSADVDPSDTTPSCVRAATLGGDCDVFRSVCPMGSTCVTASGNTAIGRCVADGTALRTRCRATGTRCDMGLQCISPAEGAEEICLNRAMTGGNCGPGTQCPEGNTCFLNDLSDRANGICGAEGQVGGACRAGASGNCDGMLVCSSMTGMGGVCSNVSTMMGAACDRLRTRCGAGLTCVLAAGSQTMGTCQPDGTVAGAECRGGDMPCAPGLTCTGSALSGGVCARTVAAGAACDPLNGTTICPMGQFCLATTFNTGMCAAAGPMEMEPNNNPSDVAMRPATAPTLYRGTLNRFEVDCYSVTVPAMGRIMALVSDGNGRCPAGLGARVVMDLYNPDGTTVRGITQLNGPFGSGSCSHIDGGRAMLYPWASGLAAGNYTVCIRGTNDAASRITTNTFNYVLSLRAGM